jgi:N-succinyldiaminopimelate aminotransferase
VIDALSSAGSFLDGGGSKPLQRAALPLFDPGVVQSELRAIHDAFRPKRERMLHGLLSLGVRVDRQPEGTFYVWGDLAALPPPLNDGMGLFRAALEQRVITVPGEFFDINPGKRRRGRASRFRGHARFSFGPSMDVVERALERLGNVVRARAA